VGGKILVIVRGTVRVKPLYGRSTNDGCKSFVPRPRSESERLRAHRLSNISSPVGHHRWLQSWTLGIGVGDSGGGAEGAVCVNGCVGSGFVPVPYAGGLDVAVEGWF